MSSLFEKIGGEDAVDAAVDKFYEKVLIDDRIKHFFEYTDMAKQARHQKRFFAYALGAYLITRVNRCATLTKTW